MTNQVSARINSRLIPSLLAAVVLCTAGAAPAYAYIDPGTGAMLLQMGAAALAGALFYFRSAWGRVAAWFTGGKRVSKDANSSEPSQQ